MKPHKSRVHRLVGQLLLCTLVLNTFVGFTASFFPAQAQQRVIIVNADQPNVWTLEQAHYLLAQMHRRNLDLRAKKLDALDPNAINGLRFDVLRTLIEAGVSYNEASGFTNQLLKQNKELNAKRRPELIAERDQLRKESLQATRDISDLEIEKAKAVTQEDKDRLAAQIAAKTSLRSQIDKEIEFKENELKTLGDASGEFKSTEPPATPFDKTKLPESVFDEAFKATTKSLIERFNQAPSLNASLMLDNFLNMQYEIIAKQLSLLRDEVGPGERLLFLELPQTVNVTHHEADKKWAQSWWKIVGYTKTQTRTQTQLASEAGRRSSECTDPDLRKLNCPPVSTSEKVKGILEAFGSEVRNKRLKGLDWIDLDAAQPARIPGHSIAIDDRSVRTVELIPRQSSLNVNDMKLRTKAGALSAVASFLFGFGARLNVQRQREQFSQFVQQELYSSAFGKGAREFGWTFTPMPGMDRLQSGVRTTYAVVVVPEEATSLVVESNGCYFPRSTYQPNDFADTTQATTWGLNKTSRGCGSSKAFILPVPGSEDGSNGFWVQGVSFQPVPKGQRIVVLISGSNFSSQIGVLVNGVPLIHAIGMAQPLLRDDSDAGADAGEDAKTKNIHGTIERVDANKLVFSFEMPPNYQGTPTITLIAPGKAIDINWLPDISVNEIQHTSLKDYSKKMFGSLPAPDSFRLDSMEVFRRGSGRLSALLHGAGFTPTPMPATRALYINGVLQTFRAVSPELIEVSGFPAPSDDSIQATLIYGNETITSEPVANPGPPRVTKVTVLSYEPATDKKPGVSVVKIEGIGFTNNLRAADPQRIKVTVTSSRQAYLTITNPGEAEVVTLTDPDANISISTVVPRGKSPD